ncbi:MAG: DNA sulfur modification protein DndB [Phenylobacterium sp. RIFCSPHIGHO2_01_FULL_69_31]|uniref:DNA sulfur modification protein DndB n=1 Tax=Phenylobacterium sp. RIFCSPHIGHO2_01_FULL_69_31 TaxID=1801944 RepID=UPI0008B6D544|nr:DNA sulfur modification protein DndB [Phenylobacterium sp. RIFCSPHIGHO2_01_FULL_69_31]OHB26292.1 MAG: DNA sulfur modification protein DndB [Phenylobacterium sp. RIFCSPHIGHO2_01_FULL_69_31]
MDDAFQYVFPAIRGVQAGREYYVSMCPLRLIPKIFLFNEEELTPELRAQRTLNKARVPDIARYITDNPQGYVFSAITASVDADLEFEPTSEQNASLGLLRIPMAGQFIINDGQHRRAAIEVALRDNPRLGDESIAVVFFSDIGLARSQQMFADLNRYAIRPATSISILYDHRDRGAELVRQLIQQAPPFRDLVEMERSNLSLRSRRLFTFSAIYQATSALLGDTSDEDFDANLALAAQFWTDAARHLPEWEQVRRGRLAASEVRQDLIHSHGVVLHALGKVGAALLRADPKGWTKRLAGLSDIDWSRNNPDWSGRAVMRGRLSKATTNVLLTANYIKQRIGLELTPEDQRVEDAFLRGDYERDG